MRIALSLGILLCLQPVAIAQWNPSNTERALFGYACTLIQQGEKSDSQIKNAVAERFVQQWGGVTSQTLEVGTQFALHFGQNGLELVESCDAQSWDMERVATFNKDLRERWEDPVIIPVPTTEIPPTSSGRNQ